MKIIGSNMQSLGIPGKRIKAGLKWRISSNWLWPKKGKKILDYQMKSLSRGSDSLVEIQRGE